MKKFLFLLFIVFLFSGCNSNNKQGDTSTTELISNINSYASFSYNDFLKMYKDDPGFKTSEFLNTEKVLVTNIDQIIELAEKECTVEYDSVDILYDSENKIYCISFYKKDYLGGNQDVFINTDGITQLIYYGE